MATNYPAGLDTLTNPLATDTLASPSHSDQHANANDAIEALQAKVGVDNSAVTTSLDYKVSQAVTLTGYQTLTNKTLTSPVLNTPTLVGGRVLNLLEDFTKLARSPNGVEDVDLATGTSVLHFTSNATNDFQVRLTYSGNAYPYLNFPIDTSFTFALVVTNGATAYTYSPTTMSIDGSNKTIKWQGGTAPTAGNANSIDVYVFTVFHRGSAVYTILGSQTKFA